MTNGINPNITDVRAHSYMNEERLQFALNGANEGLWDWDIANNVVFYSPRWKTMLGFSIDEIGSSYDEWVSKIHSDDVKMFQQSMDDHLNGITSYFKLEYRMVCKDGSHVWILGQGKALRNEMGQIVRMTGTNLDVTDKKEIEFELIQAKKEAEDSMKALVSAIRLIMGVDTPITADIINQFVNKTNEPVASQASIAKNLSNGKELTNRQVEVLQCLAKGLSNKQIAYELSIKYATVKMHVNAILKALESFNRTEAVIKAKDMGLI